MIGETVTYKNTDGKIGPICKWCGGYGFLNNMKGGSEGCTKCEGTGIDTPTRTELLDMIKSLQKDK